MLHSFASLAAALELAPISVYTGADYMLSNYFLGTIKIIMFAGATQTCTGDAG